MTKASLAFALKRPQDAHRFNKSVHASLSTDDDGESSVVNNKSSFLSQLQS